MKNLYYSPIINQFISRHGRFYTEEELDYYDELERQWKNNLPRYSFHQLIEIFPEAKSAAARGLREKIRQCQEDLVKANRLRIWFNNEILGQSNFKNQWFWTMIRDIVYLAPLVNGREKQIKRCHFYLSSLKPTAFISDKHISEVDILRAKEIPLETLFENKLRRSGARAVGECPFHKDQTPSFTIYLNTNRWHCFSCHAGADTIDFVIRRDNCDFLTAVKKLLNMP